MTESAEGLSGRPALVWSVVGLIAVLFAITNLPWHLDDYDQAKQAFTSFEMVQEGHWLYQHTPNEKIATKPPLVGWVSAAIFEVTRSWEIAWRLPSLAAAVALGWFLFRAGRNAYGLAAGALALAAFGLNLLSPRLATLVRTDMPLALIVFLLGLTIFEKVRSAQLWRARDRWMMFALLTAAMLIKGPIVYAFLLPGLVAFRWWKRDASASAWCGWWPWLGSLAVFALWVAGGIAWAPGFYEQVVLREFAGRFSETVHRPQPFYFYLPHLLHRFAPWSVLMLALAVVGWRSAERSGISERWRALAPEVAWLVVWSLGGLLVMSLIPSKRVDRIFPIIPPLCLLLAAQYAGLGARADLLVRIRRWSAVALLIACLATSGYSAHRMFIGYRNDEAALVRFGNAVRARAQENGWRYGVMGGREEGLLLYLRRTRFLSMDEAITQWRSGALDALVLPSDDLPRARSEMSDAILSDLESSVTANGRTTRYLLLTHAQP